MYWSHGPQGFVDQLGGGGAAAGRCEVMGREKVRTVSLIIKQKEFVQIYNMSSIFMLKDSF